MAEDFQAEGMDVAPSRALKADWTYFFFPDSDIGQKQASPRGSFHLFVNKASRLNVRTFRPFGLLMPDHGLVDQTIRCGRKGAKWGRKTQHAMSRSISNASGVPAVVALVSLQLPEAASEAASEEVSVPKARMICLSAQSNSAHHAIASIRVSVCFSACSLH